MHFNLLFTYRFKIYILIEDLKMQTNNLAPLKVCEADVIFDFQSVKEDHFPVINFASNSF